MGFLSGSVVKNPPANAGDMGSIPGSGRSPGGGHGNLFQYSYLENPMDRRAWQAMVHKSESEVAQSCPTFCDPVDCSPPGSSMGFSRQKYWSGLPCPPPGDLPDPRIELMSLKSPPWTGAFCPPGKPWEMAKVGFEPKIVS